MNFDKIYEATQDLEAPLQSVEDGLPVRENLSVEMFRKVYREANGQAIPTNAMTDYKKQGLSFEQIVNEIKTKLNNPISDPTLKLYTFTTNEQFDKDYDALYGNRKAFNTPLGIQARMGDNQKVKLLEKDKECARTRLLYALQFVLEDPTVIVWERATAEENKKGNSGTLIFAKSFSMDNGVRVINTVTIDRDSMRVSISNFERDPSGFLKRYLKEGNQVVYVKK